MDTTWLYWINEPIYLNKGVTQILKRKHAYYYFCKEGLFPFMKSKDYLLEGSPMKLAARLLRLVYHVWRGHHVEALPQDCNFKAEQFDLFCHSFDSLEWEQFWTRWEGFQDFEPGTFGYKFQYILPTFVWSWLDLDNSPAAYMLDKELMDLLEEEEATKGRDDPYLQETHARDYQDRHWH